MRENHHRLIGAIFLVMGGLPFLTCCVENQAGAIEPRPNIVVILADDLGYSDLGCYGGEIETPHLDRMCREGLRFSQFYSCALCGPSRASLMTGQFPHRVGIEGWTGLLNDRCVTLFELFKQAGYQTGAVGRLDMTTAERWHDPENLSRVIDRYLGSTGHQGPGHYFADVRNSPFSRNGEPYRLPEGAYKTDLITDFVVEFIEESSGKSEPFFLYVSEYAPHWPLHAKEVMEKYRERYRMLGWDSVRKGRHERLASSELVRSSLPLISRDPRVLPWEKVRHQEWEADRMAAYAAQVDSLDQSVGRILQALDDAGVTEETLVIFVSDNGASDQERMAPLDQPGLPWRLDGRPTAVGNVPENQPGSPETFMTAGAGWSSVSNAPFRGHKVSNYEGGISAPCLIRWPQVLRQRGATTDAPAHLVDLTATCLEAAGIPPPGEFPGRRLLPPSGVSLLPLFRGESWKGHDSLCWATSGNRAVRAGKWKLVSSQGGEWELYDLDADRTEQQNLAGEQPDRVRAMMSVFEVWINDPVKISEK